MATTRTFQAMLNDYLPNNLLKEELIKRDYILQKVDIDEGWKGGALVVPFMGARASSVAFGSLTGSTDISESAYVRGEVSDYVEVWGSLVFNQRDLYEHNGRMPEDSFLKILPDEIEQFMSYMKQVVSVQLGTGPHFATATSAASAASGIFVVDHVERFELGQKCTIDDSDSAAASVYVIAINSNTDSVTFSSTRGGAAANLSAYSVAQATKFYYDGANSSTFTSIRNALLSNANGGAASLHGQTKTSYPMLQAINVDGSDITETNILEKIFDAYTEVRRRAKGNANTVLCHYAHLGAMMKAIETQKGSFKVTPSMEKPSLFGWTEIEITSVKGSLTVVGLHEWDTDVIAFIDWKSMKFHTNGFFKKRKSPDGKEYFEVRNTTGYQYIVDTCLFGEMVFMKPASNGIIYGITGF